MFARLNRIEVQAGAMDEAARFWESSMLPILKPRPGFKGTLLLGDRTSGKGTVISLWESEAAYRAYVEWSSDGTAQALHDEIAPVLLSQIREDYDVLVRYDQ